MSGPEKVEFADFEEFVVARRAALLRTAYLLVGNHDDAEDLVQVSLIRAVPKWSRIAARPEPYVRKILAREAITRWRTRRWRETLVSWLPETPTIGDAQVTSDERIELQQALMKLAPRQRAVVVLRYYEDLTERETAATLGTSIGTVKSQARDALARLRQLMPSLDLDPDDTATSLPSGAAATGREPSEELARYRR